MNESAARMNRHPHMEGWGRKGARGVGVTWVFCFLLYFFLVGSGSEYWLFYAVPTARVIFTAKTSLDIFSLRCEHVWTCSVLGDRVCEMKRVTAIYRDRTAEDQNLR